MKTLHHSLVFLLLTTLCAPLWSSDVLERGDRAFSRRAAGFAETGSPDPEAVRGAVEAYEEALARDPSSLEVLFKLMEALYFEGQFVDAARRKALFERVVELGERTLDLVIEKTGHGADFDRLSLERRVELLRAVPEAAPAHFWAAIGWGLWGMSHSRLSSGARGVAAKIRDHAEMVIRLDESYADGGGQRLLGRLHTATPKIVLFTGWIDRTAGIGHLRRALELSRRDPRNLLFLAEALLEYEPERRPEALGLLREAARHEPDPEHLVEQTETLVAARRLLARLEGESGSRP